MTSGNREQFSTALGLSAVLNAVLFLGIAWAMAVHRGFFAAWSVASESAQPLEELMITVEPESAAPDVTAAMKLPEPAPMTQENPATDQQHLEFKPGYLTAPDDTPDAEPDSKNPDLVSSRNMRAASRIEGSDDGIANRPTLQASRDRPQLDLRDADFINGNAQSPAPSTPGVAMNLPSPTLTPPSPTASPTSADNASASSAGPATLIDTPPESAPLALRDDSGAATTVAAPQATVKPPDPLDPLTASVLPPPAARAGGVQISQRIGKMNGKIKNKGADSVDAVKTPGAVYGQVIDRTFQAIQKVRQVQVKDLIKRGSVVVAYEVDMLGNISNVRITNPGEANPIMQDLSITTVMKARLTPPPMELFQDPSLVVNGNRLRLTYTFLYY